ncbi:hypothetical protein KSP39_PZI019994 [Platanthera zijinensis]|uniref:Bet v I/Major latex protein domain-containing protein n=1 Tax=Platanthera zijinensis TaxID=2320716 RepID=A0AAP0FWV4_9ASPA
MVMDQYQVEADGVGVAVLWKAMTKDKIEFILKAFPGHLSEGQILEGGANGVGLGTLFLFNYGPAAANLPPFKERVVECDEEKHVVSFQGVEGGYLKLGLTQYHVSFKLEEIGNEKTLITSTMNYGFEKDFDGAKQMEEFCSNIIRGYIDSLASYLKKANL